MVLLELSFAIYWIRIYNMLTLTFTTRWANSGDNKLMMFFLFFPESGILHFMEIVSIGGRFHEMSNPFFSGKNKKNILKCCLLKILPRELSVKYPLFISRRQINGIVCKN